MRKMKQINLKKGSRQKGYILLIVALFLSVLMVASTQFFLKTTDHTTSSGMTRNSIQSVLVAESAMNLVMGRFMSGDASEDAKNSSAYIGNQVDLANMLSDSDLANMYYVTNTEIANEINITSPRILQAIANGEASAVALSAVGSQRITTSVDDPLVRMRVNDLFDTGGASTFRPSLFILNAAGLLINSPQTSWNAETSPVKAAGWLELIINPGNAQVVDVFIQAMADVDGAKSYLQRYLGFYGAGGLDLSLLNEASEIVSDANSLDRRRAIDR